MKTENELAFDALLPDAMAAKAEHIGVRKANAGAANTVALSILAGAFIALGAAFSTTVVAGANGFLPYGVKQLLAGLVFSLGLILVIVGGAELFTGNAMIVMAWASRRVSSAALLRNWLVVYVGNLTGAAATVGLMLLGRQFCFGDGAVGAAALSIAAVKTELGFVQAIALGMLCNALVCLAIWLTFSARSTTDRIVSIIPPIAAFVAAGFEHSIANMYFIPLAILIRAHAGAAFWEAIGKTPADFAGLTWGNFLAANLLPVTLGNIIGGGVMVAAVYWFVYLRRR